MTLARWSDVWARFRGRGAYPHELSFLLLLPLRRIIFSPSQLVAHLRLTEESRVLEVGPGPGFFSVEVARAVPRGRVELVDLQLDMLRKARARVRKGGVSHAGFTRASAEALPYADASFDVVFLVAVLGEVPDPTTCVASIARVLRPGGRAVFVELPGDPDVLTADSLRELALGTPLAFESSGKVSKAMLTAFERR
ncbi:MAG: methyltransferase domain-containing protein [Vicinamibacterales bacterium]